MKIYFLLHGFGLMLAKTPFDLSRSMIKYDIRMARVQTPDQNKKVLMFIQIHRFWGTSHAIPIALY